MRRKEEKKGPREERRREGRKECFKMWHKKIIIAYLVDFSTWSNNIKKRCGELLAFYI